MYRPTFDRFSTDTRSICRCVGRCLGWNRRPPTYRPMLDRVSVVTSTRHSTDTIDRHIHRGTQSFVITHWNPRTKHRILETRMWNVRSGTKMTAPRVRGRGAGWEMWGTVPFVLGWRTSDMVTNRVWTFVITLGSDQFDFLPNSPNQAVRIASMIIFHLGKQWEAKFSNHTVWFTISGAVSVEIWNWSLLGVKGLNDWKYWSHSKLRTFLQHANTA